MIFLSSLTQWMTNPFFVRPLLLFWTDDIPTPLTGTYTRAAFPNPFVVARFNFWGRCIGYYESGFKRYSIRTSFFIHKGSFLNLFITVIQISRAVNTFLRVGLNK